MYGRNLRAYQKTTVNAEISVADPYYVTKLLYQGLFERLAQAKGAIERGDLALKAKKLSTATAILENLRSTLDFSQSKTIAQGLYDIYSYMIDQVAEASLNLMTQPIDNATAGVWPVGGAWLLDHVWKYYEFNEDKEYLAEFYPILIWLNFSCYFRKFCTKQKNC